MTNLEKLKERHPDLVEEFSEMTKEELLEQTSAEMLDLFDMVDRVQLFMIECTNMTKTNYTLDVIKRLINEKQEDDLNEFCFYLMDEENQFAQEEMLQQVKDRAKQYQDKYELH